MHYQYYICYYYTIMCSNTRMKFYEFNPMILNYLNSHPTHIISTYIDKYYNICKILPKFLLNLSF